MQMQPAKHIPIPDGATHWNIGFSYPFEKHVDGKVFIYGDDGWFESPAKPAGQRYHSLTDSETGHRRGSVSLADYEIPKSAKRVNTIYGEGLLLGFEGELNGQNYKGGRRVVELDNSPFNFRPCCLFDRDFL